MQFIPLTPITRADISSKNQYLGLPENLNHYLAIHPPSLPS